MTCNNTLQDNPHYLIRQDHVKKKEPGLKVVKREDLMIFQASLIPTLQAIPWFVDLREDQLLRLAKVSEIRTIKAGEIVFQEGEQVKGLFLVLEGQVSIHTGIPFHGQVRIFTAEPLDVFGWSSLTPVVRQRTSEAVAITESRVLVIDSNALKQLCDEDHTIGYVIMKRIANVVATRLLTTRLQIMDLLTQEGQNDRVVGQLAE
jgi:CRP-like cAMP-binding protein